MKKRFILPLLFLLLLLPAFALAQEAADITAQCTVTATRGKFKKLDRLWDRDYGTTYISNKEKSPYIEVKAPAGKPLYGLYVCFGGDLTPWEVQAKKGGSWSTVFSSSGAYAHEYLPLDGEKEIRIRPVVKKAVAFTISEIFALGEGEVPSYIQRWEPAPEKADLLVLSGHPDDEILFLGGAIPTYAGERKLRVVVAYLTCGTKGDGTQNRRSELLNGLWHMGVRTYPVFGGFWDKFSKKLTTAYGVWGKNKVQEFVVELYRRFQPEVVLTHDIKGEYGHGAHLVCADAAAACVSLAADAGKFPRIASGPWQVKKLYLHLGQKNALEMDWDQPLDAFNGKTGFEVAKEAYKMHVSQQEDGYKKDPKTGKRIPFEVEPRSSQYSCYRFSLAYTAVGPDTEKNDFFENVPGY